LKTFEEYQKENAFEKTVLYKKLTGRNPSKEELIEFLHSEYGEWIIINQATAFSEVNTMNKLEAYEQELAHKKCDEFMLLYKREPKSIEELKAFMYLDEK